LLSWWESCHFALPQLPSWFGQSCLCHSTRCSAALIQTSCCLPACLAPQDGGGGGSGANLASLSAQAARLMERMVNQNLHSEMVMDFKVGGLGCLV
jgi:hypothetical protein